jgi:hypothetical protein
MAVDSMTGRNSAFAVFSGLPVLPSNHAKSSV